MSKFNKDQRRNLKVWLRRIKEKNDEDRLNSIQTKLSELGYGDSVLKAPLAVAAQLVIAKHIPAFNSRRHFEVAMLVGDALADFIRKDIQYPYDYRDAIKAKIKTEVQEISHTTYDVQLNAAFKKLLQLREVDKGKPSLVDVVLSKTGRGKRIPIGNNEHINVYTK